MTSQAKGEIALSELDRVVAAGVRFGTVLADAGYGASAAFRHGLDARGLLWAVGIPKNQKFYGLNVQLVPPPGRARKPVPSEEPRAAEDVLAERPWRRVTWRQGTKGPLSAKFAAIRVRIADGPVWDNNKHLPGKQAWLVGEWRSSGERKYYPATCRPARRFALWLPPSRRAGCASKRTSSSRESWGWATSRAGLGRGCIGTR